MAELVQLKNPSSGTEQYPVTVPDAVLKSDGSNINSDLEKARTALQEVPSTYRKAADQDVIDNALDARLDTVEAKGSGWDAKQDAISDLSTIRDGAALGATALQSVPSTYRTAVNQDTIDSALDARLDAIEGKEDDWDAKADASDIPTNTSDLNNDSGFLTEHQSLSAYRTSSAQDTIDDTKQDKMTTVSMTSQTATLDPNKLYLWSTISGTLAISFASTYTAIDEFNWEFTVDATDGLTMTYPDTVHWVGNVSGLEKGYTYQCSVMNGIGVIVGLDKSDE